MTQIQPPEYVPLQPSPDQPTPFYQPPPTNGVATASMVLGISSIPLALCCSFAGIACGIVGIVLAVQAKKKVRLGAAGAGAAKTGLICSIIGLALSAVSFAAGILMQFVN